MGDVVTDTGRNRLLTQLMTVCRLAAATASPTRPGQSRKPHLRGTVQTCNHISQARSSEMTANGCVSRVSPVQTAVRNCTRDEGGPFGFGHQELIPSYRKLLWSKAMVVSVAEKSGQRSRQAGLREASASEPLMKRRKRIRRCQNRGLAILPGSVRGMI